MTSSLCLSRWYLKHISLLGLFSYCRFSCTISRTASSMFNRISFTCQDLSLIDFPGPGKVSFFQINTTPYLWWFPNFLMMGFGPCIVHFLFTSPDLAFNFHPHIVSFEGAIFFFYLECSCPVTSFLSAT